LAWDSSDGFTEVSRAAICLWVVQALVVLTAIFASHDDTGALLTVHKAMPALTAGGLLAIRIFGVCFTLALYAWLIIKISAGRNWARITFLVLFLLSFPSYIGIAIGLFLHPSVSKILIILQFCLTAFAAVSLFTPPGRNWFHARR
jgi:hypothetical protein